MNIRKRTTAIVSTVVLGAAVVFVAPAATAAPASESAEPPARVRGDGVGLRAVASGKADGVLRTSDGAGSVKITWTWHRGADGKTYYGSFRGTFHDHKADKKHVLLQAKWRGGGWTTIRSAANGEKFKGDYNKLNSLNFRACLQGGPGKCGKPAW